MPSAAKSNMSHHKSSGVRLCVCNHWAYADNCTDVGDRLLILYDLLLAGGQLGLWIGVSCITLCEVMSFLLQICQALCSCREKPSTKEDKDHQENTHNA